MFKDHKCALYVLNNIPSRKKDYFITEQHGTGKVHACHTLINKCAVQTRHVVRDHKAVITTLFVHETDARLPLAVDDGPHVAIRDLPVAKASARTRILVHSMQHILFEYGYSIYSRPSIVFSRGSEDARRVPQEVPPGSEALERTFNDSVTTALAVFLHITEQQHAHFR